MDLPTHLKTLVNQHIAALQLDQRIPVRLYEPMHYILSMKGKRIRPILNLLAFRSVGQNDIEQALDLAISLELFHNFTLMHDDIMDRAPMRRGQPSVHTKWDENVAILSGDALFALSMGLVVKNFPEKAHPLGGEFSQVAMEVCEGQMEDMDLALEQDVEIATYIEMIRKKTAVLLGGCMSLGAIAGGASETIIRQYKEFGEALGIAFQLQDDLMDAFPPAGFGKQVGGDILENKKTYLLLRAEELASEAQRQELTRLFTVEKDPEAKVSGVLALFQELEVETHTQQLIHQYFEQARSLSADLSQHTDFEAVKDYLQVIAKRKL